MQTALLQEVINSTRLFIDMINRKGKMYCLGMGSPRSRPQDTDLQGNCLFGR